VRQKERVFGSPTTRRTPHGAQNAASSTARSDATTCHARQTQAARARSAGGSRCRNARSRSTGRRAAIATRSGSGLGWSAGEAEAPSVMAAAGMGAGAAWRVAESGSGVSACGGAAETGAWVSQGAACTASRCLGAVLPFTALRRGLGGIFLVWAGSWAELWSVVVESRPHYWAGPDISFRRSLTHYNLSRYSLIRRFQSLSTVHNQKLLQTRPPARPQSHTGNEEIPIESRRAPSRRRDSAPAPQPLHRAEREKRREEGMTTIRRFCCDDLLRFASVNLDHLTETVRRQLQSPLVF
jgi:hypothetical protein